MTVCAPFRGRFLLHGPKMNNKEPNKYELPQWPLNSECVNRDKESENRIPNIVHFVYGLEKQNYDFLFAYYLSILSAKLINAPDKIYLHYSYEPTGKWWEETKKIVQLNHIDSPKTLGGKDIFHIAHKADKVRLEVIYKFGGVYFDIDTICVSPYKHLLKHRCVMGTEQETYGKPVRLCNAVIFAEPKYKFIKKWIDSAYDSFDSEDWASYAVDAPTKLYEENKDLVHIEKASSFFCPSYNQIYDIFVHEKEIPKELITLHLWEARQRESRKGKEAFSNPNKSKTSIISQILGFWWAESWPETLYGKIMNKIKHLKYEQRKAK